MRNNAKKERHVDISENTYVSVKEEKKERCAPRLVRKKNDPLMYITKYKLLC